MVSRDGSRLAASALVLAGVLAVTAVGCRPTGVPPADAEANQNTSPAAPSGQTEVELALNWFPEAEHGGYFAALVHGYYKEAGLAVRILPGGPGAPVIQRVAGMQVAFGVENADRVLLGRAHEADVVAVMAPLQKSPRAIMVRHSARIGRIDDLQHITLAVNSGAAWVQYLKKRVPFQKVQFVPYSGNVSQFLVNENFAQQAYVFSEPFVAKSKGVEVDCLLVAEVGYNPYTSLLIAHAGTVRDRPDLARRFVAASVRGWRTYLENPQRTNEYLHQINPEMGSDILAFGAAAIRPLCLDGLPDAKSLGSMTSQRWQTLAGQLVEAEVLAAGAVDPSRAFTTQFLPSAQSAPSTTR